MSFKNQRTSLSSLSLSDDYPPDIGGCGSPPTSRQNCGPLVQHQESSNWSPQPPPSPTSPPPPLCDSIYEDNVSYYSPHNHSRHYQTVPIPNRPISSPHHHSYSTSHHYHQNYQQQQVSINKCPNGWTKVKQSSAKSPDLLLRPSWFDAETALNQIEKGKAHGNGTALWLRFMLQQRFFELGHWIHKKATAIMFIASLILVCCLAGLKSVRIEDNVEKLWIEDGGRLEKELQYVRQTLGDGYGTTNQIIIQTPKNIHRSTMGIDDYDEDDDQSSVLNASALLFHLKVMRTAITTSVQMFDETWNLKDICYTPSSPYFDKHHLNSLFENLFPCSIITPLDCFWEGSKLLGPDVPVNIPGQNKRVQWTDLNPQQMIDTMITLIRMKQSIQQSASSGDSSGSDPSDGITNNPELSILETIQKFMKRAGITTAYQRKPCLDPMDFECPITAPNHQTYQQPNIGYELTDGCYGFAAKYMHWIEDLIVGGVYKNRSGHIVRAKAIQSIVQLMGEQNLFEFHQRTIKVQNVPDWNLDKARAILQAWQRKFSEEIDRFMATTDFVGSDQYNINHFTSASLTDIMRNFSEVNFVRLAIGYLLMLAYAGFSLSRWRSNKTMRMERSQSILGMLGVLIIGLAGASGLGVCALIGLPFNASTTQIIPFLALGLGIDNMFLLAHVYTTDYMINYVPYEYRTAECLKQAGFSVLLSSLGNIVAFCAAAIIPIPALRCFSLQTAILIAFISMAVIIVFPALASIDLGFRQLYLMTIEPTTTAEKQFSTKSFLINMCFYLFCCRTPTFQQQPRRSPPMSSLQTSPSNSVSSQPQSLSSTLFTKKPYRQPYNFAYLNTQATDGSISSKKNENEICCCKTEQKNEDESMIRCKVCGGAIRTQCDGQDQQPLNNEKWGMNGTCEESGPVATDTTPIAPSTNKSPIIIKSSDKGKSSKKSTKKCSCSSGGNDLFKWWSTTFLVREYFGPFLKRPAVKVLVLMIYFIVILLSIMGMTKVNDGLDLTDIVPRGTNEYRFLELRRQYFSYYNIFAVTKGNFDYPNNQRLLYDYHHAFNRIDAIIKNDDGGLPEFWLTMFRDWLKDLQDAFDRDRQRGCITRERWFPNASAEGILAYKLLVQTGRIDNPVDKSLVSNSRLVNHQGIINPKAFYNYLTAWVSNDVMGYGASQAQFKPEPRQWLHEPSDFELKVPKSQPLIFTQIPFHLNNIRTTEEIVQTVQDVRDVCRRFEDLGLPNFPSGIPFTYWEQYIHLRFYMIMALVAVLAGIFFSTSVLMCTLWTPVIIVFQLVVNVVLLFGFMGWIGIKLSAVPAVILIVSVGVSLNSLVHITISFNTAIGNRNRRMLMALEHMVNPVKHGIISTLFGLIMLAFSEFDFIIRYFFCVLGASVVIVTLNSFILLPVLLSMIGPKPEVISLEHEDRISTPSPPPSPLLHLWPGGQPSVPTGNNQYIEALMLETSNNNGHRRKQNGSNRNNQFFFHKYRAQRRELQRVHSQLSLSTISEEQGSYHSTTPVGNTPSNTPTPNGNLNGSAHHQQSPTPMATSNYIGPQQQFVVHPEFVVETTITNNNPTTAVNSGTNSTSSSPESLTDSGNNSPSPTSDNTTPTMTTTTSTTADPASTTVTTKVMATAKLRVELHTPSPTPSGTSSATSGSGSVNNNSNIQQGSYLPPPIAQLNPMVSFPGANYHQNYFHGQPSTHQPGRPDYFMTDQSGSHYNYHHHPPPYYPQQQQRTFYHPTSATQPTPKQREWRW